MVAKRHERTLSVYLDANIISEFESFRAAFLKVIKADMKRSRYAS